MKQTYATDRFWSLYDQYLENSLPGIKRELLVELKIMRNTIRSLVRQKEGWNNIVGWEILQDFTLFPPPSYIPLDLYEGEIIIVQKQWNKDVLVTRYPYTQFMSGQIMNFFEHPVFLPLYQTAEVMKRAMDHVDVHKQRMEVFFEKEKEHYWFQEG